MTDRTAKTEALARDLTVEICDRAEAAGLSSNDMLAMVIEMAGMIGSQLAVAGGEVGAVEGMVDVLRHSFYQHLGFEPAPGATLTTAQAAELHRRITPAIIKSLLAPNTRRGGSTIDAMMLLENVVACFIAATVEGGCEDKVLDMMVANCRRRLAERRLATMPAAGTA